MSPYIGLAGVVFVPYIRAVYHFYMTDTYIDHLRAEIEPLRQQIIRHPLYDHLRTVEDLHIFMEHHVYAVWDFMSLLKSLQRSLTCVTLPWVPVGSAQTRYLINEIVTGEESDVDQQGRRVSHFELYLDAMQQSGADHQVIHAFIAQVRDGCAVDIAAQRAGLSDGVRTFMRSTFDVIGSQQTHLQAAVFTFGREDLIPDMFLALIRDLNKSLSGQLGTLEYYIERHIEVDGGHHSQLAYQMTTELCGTDERKWHDATEAVKKALGARIALWDAALAGIRSRSNAAV